MGAEPDVPLEVSELAVGGDGEERVHRGDGGGGATAEPAVRISRVEAEIGERGLDLSVLPTLRAADGRGAVNDRQVARVLRRGAT